MARLVLVDPSVRGKTGHHFNFNLAFVEQARRHGLDYGTIGSAHSDDPEVQSSLRLVRYFARYPYENAPKGRTAVEWNASLGLDLFVELQRAMDEVLRDGDIVIFHSLNVSWALACAHWAWSKLRSHRVHVVLYFMHVDYLEFPECKLSENAALYAEALRLLSECPQSRLTLIAEHGEIAADLEHIGQGRVRISEAPHVTPESLFQRLQSRSALETRAGRPVVVGYLGQSSIARGSHWVPAAMQEVLRRSPGTVCLAQFDTAYWDGKSTAPGFVSEIESLSKCPNAIVHHGSLSTEAYFEWLAEIDIMVLPYGGRYMRAGSGVFVESLATKKPMVVSRDTYMQRCLERLGGGYVVADALTTTGIADAVCGAIEQLPNLRMQARAAAAKWEQAHRLTTFFDELVRRAAPA